MICKKNGKYVYCKTSFERGHFFGLKTLEKEDKNANLGEGKV